MNKKQVAITIGLMCTLLTSGLIIQINTIKENSINNTVRTSNNDLRDEVLRWKEDYEKKYFDLENAQKELEEIRIDSTKDNQGYSEIEKKLKIANMLLGLTEVKGEGIVITVSDNESASINDENLSEELVHNTDIIELVNELKNAGAEAIAVNGQRIVSTSSISCVGSVITINNEKANSPFVISAIGNRASLSSISRPGSYIGLMEEDGITVKIEKVSEVTIPKYNKIFNSKYMETKK